MRREDAAATAAGIRAKVPPGASVAEGVATIIRHVRKDGDLAVGEMEAEFGEVRDPFRISDDELDAALAALDPAVRAGLEVAIANVRAVAEAGLDDDRVVTLPEGQTVALREVPVRRAMVYAPSGRNPYPSTVVMGAVTARAAGVDEVYVATAPHPVILAAARLCGVDGVFAITGAQAVAAFAYGTETVPNGRRDRRPGQPLGPGGQAAGVGRRGDRRLRRPVRPDRDRDAGADVEALSLDLQAQAEHGEGSLTVAVSNDQTILDALDAGEKVLAESLGAALAFVEALAPEHLQLAGTAAEALAPRIRSAGCLFVGSASGTAFGDYVAGSNHTLPTEGAARFASGLNVRHFRRRMAEVRLNDAAPALAAAGVPIAHAEGFPAHAASMAVRQTR